MCAFWTYVHTTISKGGALCGIFFVVLFDLVRINQWKDFVAKKDDEGSPIEDCGADDFDSNQSGDEKEASVFQSRSIIVWASAFGSFLVLFVSDLCLWGVWSAVRVFFYVLSVFFIMFFGRCSVYMRHLCMVFMVCAVLCVLHGLALNNICSFFKKKMSPNVWMNPRELGWSCARASSNYLKISFLKPEKGNLKTHVFEDDLVH